MFDTDRADYIEYVRDFVNGDKRVAVLYVPDRLRAPGKGKMYDMLCREAQLVDSITGNNARIFVSK